MVAQQRLPIPPDPRLTRRQSTGSRMDPRIYGTERKNGASRADVLIGAAQTFSAPEAQMADGGGFSPQQLVLCGSCREFVSHGLRAIVGCLACVSERAFRIEVAGIAYFADIEGDDDSRMAAFAHLEWSGEVDAELSKSRRDGVIGLAGADAIAVDLGAEGGIEVTDERLVREYAEAAAQGAFDVGECAICSERCSLTRSFCDACEEQHAEGGAR